MLEASNLSTPMMHFVMAVIGTRAIQPLMLADVDLILST